MGTQGPGRKRLPNQEKLTAEDDALNQIAREAEARLAARRAARAEAREIRMRELERQHKEMSDDEERMSVGSRGSLRPSDYSGLLGSSSRASSRASSARASPVVEERPDRDFMDKGSRTASTLSAATLASLGGALSRRGSCDTSFSVETEASIRDMKDSLAEAEDKYRKAMVSNAQLHNEKSTLKYEVENLKEQLGDMEELLWESRRHWDERTKELEREQQARLVLQFRFTEMEEALRRSEELLTKHGVVVSPEVSTNGETAVGEAVDDDVSTESAPRLAESSLGEVQERQPAEGVKLTQDKVKYNRSRLRKLSVISASYLTKTLLKGFDKQARDGKERHPRKNEDARKLLRNKGKSERNPTKKFKIRQFRNEGIKKQQMKNAVALPARTKPHNEAVSSNRDVLVAEMEHSFYDQICKIQTDLEGNQLLVHQSESWAKCVDLVLNVCRALTENIHKSRFVPP